MNVECPEQEACLALKGAPIGMYHCPTCGTMILAGLSTESLCEYTEEQRVAKQAALDAYDPEDEG